MERLSNAETVHECLKTLTATQLQAVMNQAMSLFPSRVCRFLDLPPELRNRIYRFAVRPEDVTKHVKEGKAPAFLKVNRQITAEFLGLYYSHEFMGIEHYDSGSKSWIAEKDSRLFQFVLAKRDFCEIDRVGWYRGSIRSFLRDMAHIVVDFKSPGSRRRGVFLVKGSAQQKESMCSYSISAIEDGMERRKYEQMRRLLEKVEEIRGFKLRPRFGRSAVLSRISKASSSSKPDHNPEFEPDADEEEALLASLT